MASLTGPSDTSVGLQMAFIVKLGSMSIVARTASEAVRTFERFMDDDSRSEPTISTFDGIKFGIESLRRMMAEAAEGTA
jgi:hypothetical protein